MKFHSAMCDFVSTCTGNLENEPSRGGGGKLEVGKTHMLRC